MKNKYFLLLATLFLLLATLSDYGPAIVKFTQKLQISVPTYFFSIFQLWGVGGFVFGILAVMCAEIYFHGFAESSLRKLIKLDTNSVRDLFYLTLQIAFFFSPIAMAIASFGLSFAQNTISDYFLELFNGIRFTDSITSIPLLLLATVVAGDFFIYWQHRIIHVVPLLWASHAIHHSAEEMTIFNYARDSPFTIATRQIVSLIPVAFIGQLEFHNKVIISITDKAAMALYFSYVVFQTINRFASHSNLNLTWGWVGSWIFVSPAMHRVHHSQLPQHQDKNFGNNFVVWDRLFGTYARPEASPPPMGFRGNDYNKSSFLFDYFLRPIINTWKEIRRLA